MKGDQQEEIRIKINKQIKVKQEDRAAARDKKRRTSKGGTRRWSSSIEYEKKEK